jgi:hypothetical protein
MRARAERLLRGDVRGEDISHLLLYVRSRSFGRQAVRDVGDFIAHRDGRDVGLSAERANEFHTTFKYLMSRLELGNKTVPSTAVSAEYLEYVKLRFRRTAPEKVRKITGMKYPAAKREFEEVMKATRLNNDGTYQLPPLSNQAIVDLLDHLASVLDFSAAITGRNLLEQLFEVFSRLELMKASEAPLYRAVSPQLLLFTVAIMHGSQIALSDDLTGQLCFANRQGKVFVSLTFHHAHGASGGSIGLETLLFETDLASHEHCEPNLLSAADLLMHEIELSAGKLALVS